MIWLPHKVHYCPDCGCREGEPHFPECREEMCPVCKEQIRWACEQDGNHEHMPERRPYIIYPPICARCGVILSGDDMFYVEKEEWERVVEDPDIYLCWTCFEFIRELQDTASGRGDR